MFKESSRPRRTSKPSLFFVSLTLDKRAPEESAVFQIKSQLQIDSNSFSILGPGPQSELKDP